MIRWILYDTIIHLIHLLLDTIIYYLLSIYQTARIPAFFGGDRGDRGDHDAPPGRSAAAGAGSRWWARLVRAWVNRQLGARYSSRYAFMCLIYIYIYTYAIICDHVYAYI